MKQYELTQEIFEDLFEKRQGSKYYPEVLEVFYKYYWTWREICKSLEEKYDSIEISLLNSETYSGCNRFIDSFHCIEEIPEKAGIDDFIIYVSGDHAPEQKSLSLSFSYKRDKEDIYNLSTVLAIRTFGNPPYDVLIFDSPEEAIKLIKSEMREPVKDKIRTLLREINDLQMVLEDE